MNSLRIEKAYRHWSHDITPEDTPLEAGLGFCIAWDKKGGFIGREALLRQREGGVTRRLVQFLLEDPEPLLYHDEPIWQDGRRVGRLTSGLYGHALGGAVGLGYVEAPRGAPTEAFTHGRFGIEVGLRPVPARASLRPLWDPASSRIRV